MNNSISRRDLFKAAGVAAVTGVSGRAAGETPVVFWSADGVGPRDAVLLYGIGLKDTDEVRVWRLPDGDPGTPGETAVQRRADAARVKILQATPQSLKCELPPGSKPGMFAVDVRAAEPVVLNRPELWFLQPTRLAPGLCENQTPPECEIEIIGKGLLLEAAGGRASVKVRREGAREWTAVECRNAGPYSVTAALPPGLATGAYELCVHCGCGGAAGWSTPLPFEIKTPELWPSRIFDVRTFGALGDDVHDDTEAIRKALAAAEANGGGVVYFPWGTYRLSAYIFIPERVVLRGEKRDATILKWPVDEPTKAGDFSAAAIYAAAAYGIEELTIIVRKANNALLDLSYELNYPNTIPAELMPRLKAWGRYRDVFLRHVMFQHWMLAGHPERQADLSQKYWRGPANFLTGGCTNFEVSDCVFMGGDQQFVSLRNSRIVRNSFSNSMGYCWTVLGGGTLYAVVTDNDITASSSWGWGWTSIQYVYSARNVSRNFVRGEREAMTLDVSAMATARPVSQYWGAPVEVGNEPGKVFLRFPAPGKVNSDGFQTGFVPGCFRGGQAIVRAANGGPGARQMRTILDNTADTIYLDKPWTPAPDTTERRMYIEIAPRHWRAQAGTTAWAGRLAKVAERSIRGEGAHWVPQEFVGMAVLILDGRGAGQYRVITSNTETEATVDREWSVLPDETSSAGIWSLMRHMIVYKCEGYDTSAFAQLYGSFYEYIVDGCKVERSQGVWGQSGWFVQLRNNTITAGYSYHPGIGGRGPTPEKNLPYGYSGLADGRLRITKSVPYQYSGTSKVLFVDEVLGKRVPGGLGTILRRNHLSYNQRLVMGLGGGDWGAARFRDAVIDGNVIEHGEAGIQIDQNVYDTVVVNNRFTDVKTPYLIARPDRVLVKP